MSLVPLPEDLPGFLAPYLPPTTPSSEVFVTLTYAQSLDAKIAASPGIQTKISHLETKSMTHYLRAQHDAIMVGIGTVLADDPKLNCRFPGSVSPRPIILDPKGQFVFEGSSLQAVTSETGLFPLILVDEEYYTKNSTNPCIVIPLPLLANRSNNWTIILEALKLHGIHSVMVEGGAVIINELLKSTVVNSVIVTIGAVYLGAGGVGVAPSGGVQMQDVTWWSGIQDSVVCGRIRQSLQN